MTPLTADDVADCIAWAATRPEPREHRPDRGAPPRPGGRPPGAPPPDVPGLAGAGGPQLRAVDRAGVVEAPGVREGQAAPEGLAVELRRPRQAPRCTASRRPWDTTTTGPARGGAGVVHRGRSPRGHRLVRLPAVRQLTAEVAVGHRAVAGADPGPGDLAEPVVADDRGAPSLADHLRGLHRLGLGARDERPDARRDLEPVGQPPGGLAGRRDRGATREAIVGVGDAAWRGARR